MEQLFKDVIVKETKKSPKDWTIEDCKKELTVIFRDSKNPLLVNVSVRLLGLVFLRIDNDKTSIQVSRGSITEGEILKRVKSCDNIILEARNRLILNLRKAEIKRSVSRET